MGFFDTKPMVWVVRHENAVLGSVWVFFRFWKAGVDLGGLGLISGGCGAARGYG